VQPSAGEVEERDLWPKLRGGRGKFFLQGKKKGLKLMGVRQTNSLQMSTKGKKKATKARRVTPSKTP